MYLPRRHYSPRRYRIALAALAILISAFPACKRRYKTSTEEVGSTMEGRKAPTFSLAADNGSQVSLADFVGKSKVILVFYRGYW